MQLDWLHAIKSPNVSLSGYQAEFNNDDALRIGVGYEHHWTNNSKINMQIDYTNASGGNDNVGARLGWNYKF